MVLYRSLENTPLKPRCDRKYFNDDMMEKSPQRIRNSRKRTRSLELENDDLYSSGFCKFGTIERKEDIIRFMDNSTSWSDLLTPTKPRHQDFPRIQPFPSSPLVQYKQASLFNSQVSLQEYSSMHSSYWNAIDNDLISLLSQEPEAVEKDSSSNDAAAFCGPSQGNQDKAEGVVQFSIEHKELLSYWGLTPPEDQSVNQTLLAGFSTAKGKKLTAPSSEAINKAISILGSSEDGQKNQGFVTAKGNPCKDRPSEAAILKAKELFEEKDYQESGFRSAGGRPIPQPSKEALVKSSKYAISTSPKKIELKKVEEKASNINIHDYKRSIFINLKLHCKTLSLMDWYKLYKRNLKDEPKALPLKTSLDDSFAKGLQNELFSNKKPSVQWIRLQYKFIVWKLHAYNNWFTMLPHLRHIDDDELWRNVKGSIQERWERDSVFNSRSILRQIVEKDQSSMPWMVLFVSRITQVKAASDNSFFIVLYLSDGWYEVLTIMDNALLNQLYNGRIFIGQKLNICNGRIEMSNEHSIHEVVDNYIDEPQISDQPVLKICFNSTKRARWYEKLGRKKSFAFSTSLDSLNPEGGIIPCICVTVKGPKLPICYMDRSTMKTTNVHMHTTALPYGDDRFVRDSDGEGESCQEPNQISAFVSFVAHDGCSEIQCKKIHTRTAVIRIWNPPEELLEQMDKLTSGTACKIFQLKPFKTQQWTDSVIWLESTKMTTILLKQKSHQKMEIAPLEWSLLKNELVLDPFVTIDAVVIDIVPNYETVHPFDASITQIYESVFIASCPQEPLGVISIRTCSSPMRPNKWSKAASRWHSIKGGSWVRVYNLTFHGRDPRYGYYLFYENDYTWYDVPAGQIHIYDQDFMDACKEQVRKRAMGEL